jgi:hypothetical protein
MAWLIIELVVAKDNEKSKNAARIFHTCPDVKTISNMLSVARDGIEPPTRGFSVRCSTN